MKEGGFGNLFLRHLVMSIPWAVTLLVAVFVGAFVMKQQIKEGIQFALATYGYETANLAYRVGTPLNQNTREAIEFFAKTARKEIKDLINDPQVKENLKELIEQGKREK